MKLSSLNFLELEHFCSLAQCLVDGRVQEVWTNQRGVGFFVWKTQKSAWLWFDLTPKTPFPALIECKRLPFVKKIKPLGLFVKSHVVGNSIKRIYCKEKMGRVIFIEGDTFSLEIRLFPHGQNLIVKTAEKSISWLRVKALKGGSSKELQMETRDLQELQEVWLKSLREERGAGQGVAGKDKSLLSILKRDLLKKEKALVKIKESLEERLSNDWLILGKLLQEKQSLNISEKWKTWINEQESLSFNIQMCFEKHKSQKKKIVGTRERIGMLKDEINLIKNKIENFDLKGSENNIQIVKSEKSFLRQAEAKGKKLVLSQGKEAVIGKSARDNLAILRRAKPWFLWVHIKDSPGAYGVVLCQRKQVVTDEELRQVCRWLLKESKEKGEGSFDFLIAECRYITPIKGDRIGRVTYKNERVITVGI